MRSPSLCSVPIRVVKAGDDLLARDQNRQRLSRWRALCMADECSGNYFFQPARRSAREMFSPGDVQPVRRRPLRYQKPVS